MKNITAVIAAVVAFSVTAILGFIVIPYLRKLKFGQTILEIGPKWHEGKKGTPTMGGIMIIIGVIIALAAAYGQSAIAGGGFANELNNPFMLSLFLSGLVMALGMGAIGFIDDYIKVVKKRNLGLTAKQKTFLQLLVSALYLMTLALCGVKTTYIPFIGDISVTSGFGLIFWPIALMFVYGFTNAVNLTDGLDGLASSVTLVVSCFFMLICGYLNSGALAGNVTAAATGGACAGFRLWNSKPAKVFMGDTGSMFLGGMVVALSFSSGRPILLILSGMIYLIEALSVMIQVGYYKKTKKRIFKMAPIHHHFEMCGWSEEKVVFVFSVFTLAVSVGAMFLVIYG
ncbi:MAG: phospho-N-acetylmuramoyl-pentapeptide-transferase [Clostridia bacterium]|nr:phospho-N-acetylmuramoyl-pentapeptide-transferase [Clostridia bacterium]